jgi:23S rRNA (cytidine1920-2'-O)/16S rRNA (cytidine1409-2'-O)-methyltransferase
MIMAGLVQVDKRLLDKPGHPIPVSAAISLKEPFPPYVSRGGLKLEAALDQFAVDVRGKVLLDVGASTGGLAGREKGYCCGCGIRPTPLENTAGSPR